MKMSSMYRPLRASLRVAVDSRLVNWLPSSV